RPTDRGCRLERMSILLLLFHRAFRAGGPRNPDDAMRFHLVDRIVAVETGKSIRAIKHLTLGEEYLADHFPTFPVMPGELQLQTLVEAGGWVLRLSEGYSHSVWVLREARNVKYGTFMPPGHQLEVAVELVKRENETATLRGRGEVDGQQTVSAQIVLVGY